MPNTTPPSGCGLCGKKNDLLRCSGCKVMPYCSPEHQTSHRSEHKSACNAIKRCRGILDTEEQTLRQHPGDFTMPANPFINGVGHFWGILDTRNYMRARYALVEEMKQIKTVESMQAQLDHLLDMLRLCRGDNLGVRDLVPALMLRLNKRQECYDFVKWWTLISDQSDYDWGNIDLPYLDIKNADMFEPVDYLCHDYLNLPHTVAMALLKIKLLLDRLSSASTMGATGHAAVSQSPITSQENHADVIDRLKSQVDQLYKAVRKANRHFWPALINPGTHLTTRPGAYSTGSVEEMQLTLLNSYDSWAETPGAIEYIKVKDQQQQQGL